MAYVVEVGGEGTVDRLFDLFPRSRMDDGKLVPMTYEEFSQTLKGALVETSGLDAGTLMKGWHARIMAARPEQGEGAKKGRIAGLMWVMFFGALATRSTRWRLG